MKQGKCHVSIDSDREARGGATGRGLTDRPNLAIIPLLGDPIVLGLTQLIPLSRDTTRGGTVAEEQSPRPRQHGLPRQKAI